MKKSFDDKSSIEFRKSTKPKHIFVIVSAKDMDNPLKKITNAAEISIDDLKYLVSDLDIEING